MEVNHVDSGRSVMDRQTYSHNALNKYSADLKAKLDLVHADIRHMRRNYESIFKKLHAQLHAIEANLFEVKVIPEPTLRVKARNKDETVAGILGIDMSKLAAADLNLSLDVLCLSTRANNGIMNSRIGEFDGFEQIIKVEHILKVTYLQLRQTKNMGPASLDEIRARLMDFYFARVN